MVCNSGTNHTLPAQLPLSIAPRWRQTKRHSRALLCSFLTLEHSSYTHSLQIALT